jgi:S1-C subfamily serine protease
MLSPPADLKAVPLGDAGKVKKGDLVIGLANPYAAGFRDGSPSASWGIVSNLRRRAPGSPEETKRAKPLAEYGTLLQTDVRINLGCSGGALLNLDGELVGLTTALAAIAGGEAAGGYALPMTANARKMIAVLQRGEEIDYGFLGVSVNPEDRGGDATGVVIQDVTAGMPAARAGLFPRDVVTAIDDNPVREQDDLFLYISAALAGYEAKITVNRGGTPRTVKVRLAKSPGGEWADRAIASKRHEPVHGLRVDYVSTLGVGVNLEGVLVKGVEPGSPAAKKLLEWVGRAVVTAVDGQPVATPTDFYRLAEGKGSVTLDLTEVGGEAARKKVTLP